MYTGIGSAGAGRTYCLTKNNIERILNYFLDGNGIWLQLPSMIRGTLIGDKYKITCFQIMVYANISIQDFIINLKKTLEMFENRS